ncbi:MAG: Fe-S cluster assembly sulfur transfer protein SufU [Opitutales bacterium]
MSQLDDLYQSIILDHNKRPRNYGALPDATHQAEGYNPLCGDKVNVYLNIENAVIRDIQFESASCAICKASASIMAQELKGKNLSQALALQEKVQLFISEEFVISDEDSDLVSLQGLRKFPARINCATLPWNTFLNAVHAQVEA